MPVPGALFYSNDIKGSNTVKDRDKSSEIIELHHTVRIPIDARRGTISGKRVHEPVTVMKEIDTASPQLYQACAEGKTLDFVDIAFYRITAEGLEKEYYSIRLEQVKVAAVEAILPNTQNPQNDRLTHYEKVRFMYEKVTWKHADGLEYTDSWTENA